MPGLGERVRSPAGRVRSRHIAGAFAALATLLYLAVGKSMLRDSQIRYELTIEVETPDAAMFAGQNAQSCPDLVVVDPADIESIRAVDPRESERVLGDGICFAGMRIAIADTPPLVTLDQRAPWVLGISQKLDRIASTSGPLRHGLNPSRLIARS
ncbi:hypothetical protein AB2M62_10460 [Sphingomonas sp. MMS12-HWE2-04]|uniref:hypothetical protein n=1 Tax=Sphingomonas sp. MMS12-HWE2-04 TaxID=3234199 RepID=UPI00384E12D3